MAMAQKKIINLIPRELPKKAAAVRGPARLLPRNKLIRNIALILILPIGYGVWLAVEANTLQARLSSTREKLKGARAGLTQTQAQSLQLEKEKSDLLKELESRSARLNQLLATTPGQKDYAMMLMSLVGFMPKDLWLAQIVLSDEKLELAGSALSPELVVQLTGAMDKSGALRNSVFTSSERQTVQSHIVYNFKITAEPVWAALSKKGDGSLPQ